MRRKHKMTMAAGGFASRVVATAIVSPIGDGDFTDIQEAIDSLPSTGGVVYVKEGTYTITTGLTINVDNTAILGAGKATIVTTSSNIRLLKASNRDGILIQNLNFIGTDNILHDLNYGIEFDAVTESFITGCWFSDSGTNGIWVHGAGSQIIMTENIVKSCQFSGILIQGVSRFILSNNISDSNGQAGIRMETGGAHIIGNHCNSNSANGIYLTESSNSRIIGNFCDSNSDHGIELDSNVDQSSVIGNTSVNHSGKSGIQITNSNCDNNIVMGNVSKGNGTNEIVDNGTGTQIGLNEDGTGDMIIKGRYLTI